MGLGSTNSAERGDAHRDHPEPITSDESEPTPGSDGDGAEAGYTPPAELPAEGASPEASTPPGASAHD